MKASRQKPLVRAIRNLRERMFREIGAGRLLLCSQPTLTRREMRAVYEDCTLIVANVAGLRQQMMDRLPEGDV